MKSGLYGFTILETDEEAALAAKAIQARAPSPLLAKIIANLDRDMLKTKGYTVEPQRLN
jgi:hypothetical protein